MNESRNLLSATEQPNPIGNTYPACWECVIDDVTSLLPDGSLKTALITDMADRDDWGRSKYGVPLQPHNGRDALVDLYQEFLDAIVYTKQYQLENPEDASFMDVYQTLLQLLVTVKEQLIQREGKR